MLLQKKHIFLPAIALSFSAHAWDVTGHVIIAQIAYDNLTPIAREDVNYLTECTSFSEHYPNFSPYIYSAPWPDQFKHTVEHPH